LFKARAQGYALAAIRDLQNPSRRFELAWGVRPRALVRAVSMLNPLVSLLLDLDHMRTSILVIALAGLVACAAIWLALRFQRGATPVVEAPSLEAVSTSTGSDEAAVDSDEDEPEANQPDTPAPQRPQPANALPLRIHRAPKRRPGALPEQPPIAAPPPLPQPESVRAQRRSEPGLSASDIRRVVADNEQDVKTCYSSRRPQRDKLELRLTIDPSGAVSGASVRSTHHAGEEVTGCVAVKTKSWRFPARARVKPEKVVVPFVVVAGG
jgi:hypothetical protein